MELPQTPSFRLDGKRALITGAGRGIGRASAAGLAKAGAHVTLWARSQADLEDVAEQIIQAGGHADILPIDITDTRAVIAEAEKSDAFDILINNAGTNRPGSFLDASERDFDAVFDLNVRAAFFTAQTVARAMVDAGNGGSIINISSALAHVVARDRTVYCASKSAIEGLSKAMAIDLAPYNIRVNTVCPTFTETPMTVDLLSQPQVKRTVLEKVKLGRVGQVEDLMGAIIYLASDAGAFVTGTPLKVDGGWSVG